MLINLDRLLLYDHSVYDRVVNAYGYKTGSVNYREDQFPADVWLELLEFTEHQKTTPPSSPAPPQRDFEAEVRADLDKAAANGRLLQLAREEGLLDVESNGKQISDFFRDHKLVLNVANVDKAVAALRSQLAWRPAPPPAASTPVPVAPPAPAALPAAPPPPPAEVLGLVAGTNEPQLPIESSEYVLRRASKAQVADWLKRMREKVPAKPTRFGHFGAKF